MGMRGAHSVSEQELGKGPQQAWLPCGTLTPASVSSPVQPGCVSHSHCTGDVSGDKSPLLFFILQLFTKYLQPSSRANIILIAIKNMRSRSDHSISLAAYMVETLVSGSAFYSEQVSSPWVARPMLQPTRGWFLLQLHAWLVHLKLADCNGDRSSSQWELGK